MIDPRSDIISLFTDSRIGASSMYSGTSVYVKLLESEGQEEREPNDYGRNYVGIIWLRPPRVYSNIHDISYNHDISEIVVDCHLYIPKNTAWFKPGGYSSYIRQVLDTLQTTLRSNQTGKSWHSIRLSNIPDSLTGGDNPNVYGRVIEVVCMKID